MQHMIRSPKAERIDLEIGRAFNEIREAERALTNHPVFTEVRASSFPICPRAYHISRRMPKKYRPNQTERFMGEASTLMGTALHLVLQKWFGIVLPENWYGNYECIYCNRVVHNKYGQQRCKKCGREMLYREYSVEKQKGIPFSGHIDGILRFDDGENYLIDFKGAYASKLKKIKQDGSPILSHYCQTNAYANAINKGKVECGDLKKIHKIMVLYIERGLPHILWQPVQVTPSEKIFRQTKEFIKIGKRSLKTLEIPTGFCSTAGDDDSTWCPWKSVCFSPNLRSMLGTKIYKELAFKKPAPRTLDLVLQADYLKNQV